MHTETIVEPECRDVESLDDYLRQLQDFSLYLDKIGEGTGKLHMLFFRGQSEEYLDPHKKPLLYPKLFRSDSREAKLFKEEEVTEVSNQFLRRLHISYYDRETELLNEVINEYPERFSSFPLWLDRLAIAQHFGVATRLLDITRNALVALYFAVADVNSQKDGVVYVFSADNRAFDLSLRNNDVAEAFANPNTWRRDNVKAALSPSLKNKDIKPIIVSSRFVSERQRRQLGYFILFPNKVARWKNKHIVQPYAGEVRSVVIPKDKKAEIRLDLARI